MDSIERRRAQLRRDLRPGLGRLDRDLLGLQVGLDVRLGGLDPKLGLLLRDLDRGGSEKVLIVTEQPVSRARVSASLSSFSMVVVS